MEVSVKGKVVRVLNILMGYGVVDSEQHTALAKVICEFLNAQSFRITTCEGKGKKQEKFIVIEAR